MLPEMTAPDFVIELATITLIVDGSVAGGPEVMPVSVVHVPPQKAGLGVVLSAKPLKAEGAAPPLNELDLAHFAPQNVTCCPTTALRSPMTKLKPDKG
jgi:hypothetical protein